MGASSLPLARTAGTGCTIRSRTKTDPAGDVSIALASGQGDRRTQRVAGSRQRTGAFERGEHRQLSTDPSPRAPAPVPRESFRKGSCAGSDRQRILSSVSARHADATRRDRAIGAWITHPKNTSLAPVNASVRKVPGDAHLALRLRMPGTATCQATHSQPEHPQERQPIRQMTGRTHSASRPPEHVAQRRCCTLTRGSRARRRGQSPEKAHSTGWSTRSTPPRPMRMRRSMPLFTPYLTPFAPAAVLDSTCCRRVTQDVPPRCRTPGRAAFPTLRRAMTVAASGMINHPTPVQTDGVWASKIRLQQVTAPSAFWISETSTGHSATPDRASTSSVHGNAAG